MRFVRRPGMSPGFLVAAFLSSNAGAVETVWVRQLDAGACDSSVIWADADPEPGQELVMTTTSGLVVVWDTAGRPVHRAHLGGVFSTPPTAAELFSDGPAELLVVDQAGVVRCLGGRKNLWEYRLGSSMPWNSTTIVAEDLDGDGSREVLVGDAAGHLVCLSREGVERWTWAVAGGFHCPPAVADLRPEPGAETVITTGSGQLVCLSAAGRPIWVAELGCDNSSGPVIADLDGAGGYEIVVGGRDGRLRSFDAAGRPLWSFAATGEIDSSIACGDIDGDGRLEIIFVDLRGKCFCLGSDGRMWWRYDVRNRCRRPPSLADFDGDGQIEVLVVGYDSRMYLLSADGQEEDITDVPGTTNGGATVIEAGGRLCAVIPYGDGRVGCYSWYREDAGRRHRVLWGAYRVTPTQRGSVLPAERPAEAPSPAWVSYGPMFVGRNLFEMVVANPRREELVIELAVQATPGETRQTHVTRGREERITAVLPYLVRGEGPETFVFSYVVRDASGATVFSGRRSVFVEPFLRDMDAVRSLLDRLAELETKLRDVHHRDVRELAGRRLEFERQRAALAERVAHPSRLSGADRVACAGDLRALAAAIEPVCARARITLDCLEAGKPASLAVWPANPWSPIRPVADRARLSAAADLTDLSGIMLYRNEFGSLAMDVMNLLDVPLDVRVQHVDRLAGAESPALWLGEVIPVPTELLTLSPDAISPLNKAGVLHLAPGEIRQLWIGIDATASRAGTFTGAIMLSSLECESVSTRVPVTVEVADLDIAAAPAPRFCNWAYLNTSCVKEHEAEARRDLVSHGTNVFVVNGGHLPGVQYDATGRLTSRPDFTRHDAFLRQYGPDAMFLFASPQATLSGPKEHGPGSEAYRKAYLAWIPQWVAHLADLGIGYDRFAFYPVDEPGLTPGLVEQYIEIARLTREADPRILMYADPVGRATLEEIERMAPFVDIWCPNRNGYLMGGDDPRLAVMHRHGKHVWTYECDGNAKNLSPLGYYRGLAWLAARYGLTGIGFWSYCTSPHDPWYVPRGDHDYLLIYPGAGVITSRRWEACRDGLEDLRALWQLGALADVVRRADPNDPRVLRADKVRAAATAELSEFCRETAAPGTATRRALAAPERSLFDSLDAQHQAYRLHRRRIAEASLALRG